MMHSISATLIKPFSTALIKPLANLICIALLFITQTAHADFRKALDAYQARDGATMLKEVKDAVDKKNDDGLMLLLMATNMDAATSDYDETTKQSKSTLRAILPQPKWDEMRELLVQATNNSTMDVQYYFNVENRQFSREFMIKLLQQKQEKRGEKPKKEYVNQELNQAYSDIRKGYIDKGVVLFADYSSASMITKQAESGDPYAQSLLGFFSLGFSDFTVPACEEIKDYTPLCKARNENKGYAWLKRAVKSYEQDGLLNEAYGKFATSMCSFLLRPTYPNLTDLRQAYLWCFMGANLGNIGAEDMLGKMYKSGQLKAVAPKLNAVWNTRKRADILLVKNIKEYPDMVLEARKDLSSENTPLLSYLFFGRPDSYALDVYADGRVFIKEMQVTGHKTLLTKVSPKTTKQFLAKLNQIGIKDWPLFSGWVDCGSCLTPSTYMLVTLRDGDSVRRLAFPTGLERFDFDENARKNTYKIAKVKSIVDTYFPTKHVRIELGNKGKEQQRKLDEEKKWVELTKIGESK